MIRHTRLLPLWLLLTAIVLPMFPVGSANADDGNPLSPAPSFAGRFSNGTVTVELAQSDTGYAGTITKGANKFPAKATVTAQSLTGTFDASGADFPYSATLANDQMILVVGKTTYTLTRAAANPLDMGAAPAPTPTGDVIHRPRDLDSPDPDQHQLGGAGSTFGDFSVLGATEKGKTLFLKLPGGQTIEAAITQTADTLGKVLDAKPSISGAFADSKGKATGGATFTGTLQGQSVQGTILASTGADHGSANVIFAAADASQDDIAALMDFIPKPLKMTTNKFPDGSGSIDLPDGWTSPTQSASNGIVSIGPAGQAVGFCMITEIYDPNCRTVRMSRSTYKLAMQNYQFQLQNYNHMVAMHQQNPNLLAPGNPPQPPVEPDADPNDTAMKMHSPLRYCAFCDGPEEVLKNWYPIGEELGKRYGTPYTSLQKVIAVIDAPSDPAHPGVKSGIVYIAMTDHDGDKVTPMRALNQIFTSQVMAGEVWQLTTCVMRAPDATFDKDLPVMKAIMNSVKVDENVVTGEINAAGAAARKMGQDAFDAMEKNHAAWQDQQAQQFADHERQIAAQEKAVHDSSSDMIEFALGLRDVYDNQTGQMHKVDLFHVNGIVAAENAAANDPDRFVAIPLRYER